jgi:phospholipid/cholesterol/gamma-HCH transport system permease protein
MTHRTRLPVLHRFELSGPAGGEMALSISGRVSLETLEELRDDVEKIFAGPVGAALRVDLSGIRYLDSAGALALLDLRSQAEARGIAFQFVNAAEESRRILNLLDRPTLKTPPLIFGRKSANILEQAGESTRALVKDFLAVMEFVGELIRGLAYSLIHPRSVRWDDVVFYMKRAGMDGLPIVSLISFLIGLVIAFMSSLQLKQFGAYLYVASLVAIAIVRELGPLMTGIIVAGRSGSAFGAEIGTMMVNEEVDALRTLGFDPTRFLAVPKVIAAMLVVPLLTLYADVFGILGGLLIGVMFLDLTVYSYVDWTLWSIGLFDIVSSLVKSVVFAALIAGIGCQRGFGVRGGAAAVGSATTSAVVAAIFLIIVVDSIFAVILHYVR